MARVFSGIKPTGEMHLGNYLGAVRRWVDTQPAGRAPSAARDHDAIFCVVDLHAMTLPCDPAELTAATRRLATILLAAGLDPDRSPAVRAEPRARPRRADLGAQLRRDLRRAPPDDPVQGQERPTRRGGQESVSVGLFDYPVLMVSDILLYDTDEVPVGDDQRQHVELARDIAHPLQQPLRRDLRRPEGHVSRRSARGSWTCSNPTRKMSKSEDSPQGTILVLDPPKAISKKIKSAVTDSGAEVRHDREAKPGVSNLIEIYGAVTGARSPTSSASSPAGSTARSRRRSPRRSSSSSGRCRTRYAELAADPGEVDRRLAVGADAAEAIADPVLARARRAPRACSPVRSRAAATGPSRAPGAARSVGHRT